jgi:hypothetical protein
MPGDGVTLNGKRLPSVSKRNHPRYSNAPGSHVGGMHLRSNGEHAGACMCDRPCCFSADAGGCICRVCSGAGHENCVAVNAKRAKTQAANARYAAKRMAVARSGSDSGTDTEAS